MNKIAVLHYMPLEYYPPITNLLDYIVTEHAERLQSVKVYSCRNVNGRKDYWPIHQEGYGPIVQQEDNTLDREIKKEKTKEEKIKKNQRKKKKEKFVIAPSLLSIKRSPFPQKKDNSLVRLFKYLHYNIFTLVALIFYSPDTLLYYESYSAWPAYIYTRFINPKCRIFIHNHEYSSKEWYAHTMKQLRYYHQLEKKWLYPRAQWISQTNSDRLNFFHEDHPYLKKEQLNIMPNYPPHSWNKGKEKRKNAKTKELVTINNQLRANNQQPETIKLVYVGSLSFQSTYLKELCEWVNSQDGKIQFDIYAYNLYNDVKAYLKQFNSPSITYFEEGIEYNNQPNVLANYDVGLILYKAHNQNFTYNAPNKLFEYLACGLDIWYPNVLQGPIPYLTKSTYPKVIPVDFENLTYFNWQKAIDKDNCVYKPSEYFCENVYMELIGELMA